MLIGARAGGDLALHRAPRAELRESVTSGTAQAPRPRCPPRWLAFSTDQGCYSSRQLCVHLKHMTRRRTGREKKLHIPRSSIQQHPRPLGFHPLCSNPADCPVACLLARSTQQAGRSLLPSGFDFKRALRLLPSPISRLFSGCLLPIFTSYSLPNSPYANLQSLVIHLLPSSCPFFHQLLLSLCSRS